MKRCTAARVAAAENTMIRYKSEKGIDLRKKMIKA